MVPQIWTSTVAWNLKLQNEAATILCHARGVGSDVSLHRKVLFCVPPQCWTSSQDNCLAQKTLIYNSGSNTACCIEPIASSMHSFVPLRLHLVEISTSGFLTMARQFTRLIGLHSMSVETNPLMVKKKSIATAHKRGRSSHSINSWHNCI